MQRENALSTGKQFVLCKERMLYQLVEAVQHPSIGAESRRELSRDASGCDTKRSKDIGSGGRQSGQLPTRLGGEPEQKRLHGSIVVYMQESVWPCQ